MCGVDKVMWVMCDEGDVIWESSVSQWQVNSTDILNKLLVYNYSSDITVVVVFWLNLLEITWKWKKEDTHILFFVFRLWIVW